MAQVQPIEVDISVRRSAARLGYRYAIVCALCAIASCTLTVWTFAGPAYGVAAGLASISFICLIVVIGCAESSRRFDDADEHDADVDADEEDRILCDKPPAGWSCSRPAGHKGPCAALPVLAE